MKQLTTEQFINKARLVHGDKYDYSKTAYIKSNQKVIIICPKHGEFEQRAGHHLSGKGCPKCCIVEKSDNQRKTKDKFIQDSIVIHGNKYNYDKVIYKNAKTKIIITCPIHGDFEQFPYNHLQGKGCPRCNSSKGEQLIKTFLINNNIIYQEQFKIEVPINIRERGYCKVDFFLPDYNCIIEYNGEQHYKPIERFGGQLKFEKQQIRDSYIKNYCKDNNISFIEIPYNLTNIEVLSLLNEYFNNFYKK